MKNLNGKKKWSKNISDQNYPDKQEHEEIMRQIGYPQEDWGVEHSEIINEILYGEQ